MKVCRTCGSPKDLAAFYRERTAADGYRSDCKVCHRAKVYARRAQLDAEGRLRDRLEYHRRYNLQQRYELSPAELEAMWEEQEGHCGICSGDGPLEIDHSHATGAVRALLCHPCNQRIAFVENGRAPVTDEFRALAEVYLGLVPC